MRKIAAPTYKLWAGSVCGAAADPVAARLPRELDEESLLACESSRLFNGWRAHRVLAEPRHF
jgi:hypothetical protein